jgi:hypothetical protein
MSGTIRESWSGRALTSSGQQSRFPDRVRVNSWEIPRQLMTLHTETESPRSGSGTQWVLSSICYWTMLRFWILASPWDGIPWAHEISTPSPVQLCCTWCVWVFDRLRIICSSCVTNLRLRIGTTEYPSLHFGFEVHVCRTFQWLILHRPIGKAWHK